ncbi:MAG: hypothetical protein GVY13_15060 [Alphaproteobacteria bacterium]|jgi:peptidoglycan hydrolase-like protein with peptidoglycan-binding domain|nr:hypothetical protein [Alphaproteobacteria bacterium]
MMTIGQSVGRGGVNARRDVSTIQALLNANIQKIQPRNRLTVNGQCGASTIAAIEAFQRQVVGMNSPDGRVDPNGGTLKKLNEGAPQGVTVPMPEIPQHSNFNFINRTEHSPRDKRKSTRNLSNVYALVLHQTAFSRGSNITKYDKVTAHYCLLPDGTILQLHPQTAYLWASNGFNAGSVAIEIVGNFRSDRGRWWNPEKMGRNYLTAEQIASGRGFLQYLINDLGITHVLAHRQAKNVKANCPGPDIWGTIGQWGVDELGLNDGGQGFKISSGNPIPETWRSWGYRP